MTDDTTKRAQLIENRKSIANEAAKISDACDTSFFLDAGLAGGLATALTSVFAMFASQTALTIGVTTFGFGFAAVLAKPHVKNSFNQDMFNKMAEQAKQEAFDFEDGSIENQKLITFKEYALNFKAQHKNSPSSLNTTRSAIIMIAISSAIAFTLALQDGNYLRKDEDIEDNLNQGSYPALVPQP